MNWNAVLAQIREDFEDFLNEGGWRFLQDDVKEDEGSEAEDSELVEDPEFNDDSDDSMDDSEVESDFSDEEDDESSSGSEDDDQSDGLSWDELEKKAYADDKQAAQKRQMANDDRGAGQKRRGRR
jgi:nucleosome binding factor SPN SPT16 subunit